MDLITAFWEMRNSSPMIGGVVYFYMALTAYSTICFIKERIS